MRNMLEYKGYLGSVEFNSDDEVFHGRLEGIRDLVSYEATDVDGLKRAFHEAVDDYLVTCQKKRKQPEQVFKGVFNVRLRPELHRRAFIYSTEHKKKLNNIINEALEQFLQIAAP
ncbi:MAG TPA: type II toxin-antitoxin system HicB family antitoxin [Bryobacteraceae bacterium]|nr:type II toxin-antitoxin system HicB family antitoxin [Bryobacteraceae bacterium]